MAQSILELKCQTIRYNSHTVKIPTRLLQGIDCVCLHDVQQQFPSVRVLRIGDIQQPFVSDEYGELLKPLRIAANFDEVIDAVEPVEQSNSVLQERFDRIDENMNQLRVVSDQTLANTQEMLRQIKYVMTQMYELQEYSTPHYFFIYPVTKGDIKSIDGFYRCVKLYFLCECSDDPAKMHVALHPGYKLKNSKSFIEKYGPYLMTTLHMVECIAKAGKVLLPVAQSVAKELCEIESSDAQDILKMCEKLILLVVGGVSKGKKMLEALSEGDGKDTSKAAGETTEPSGMVLSAQIRAQPEAGSKEVVPYAKNTQIVPKDSRSRYSVEEKLDLFDSLGKCTKPTHITIQGPQLREMQAFLERVDKTRSLGNLFRTFTPEGHVRWVCGEHYQNWCTDSKQEHFIKGLNAMGGTYNETDQKLVIVTASLSHININSLCDCLKNGFSVRELVLQGCSLNEDDCYILIETIVSRSPIENLELTKITVRNRLGIAKYKIEHMLVTLTPDHQLVKIRFEDSFQDGNMQIIDRLLSNQNFITLDISASDLLNCEREFQNRLDAPEKITRLDIEYANNIDILQIISKFKKLTLKELALRKSLREASIAGAFCKLLVENETLVELDLIDDLGFEDEIFIDELLNVVKYHVSIKDLSLHLTNIRPSTKKERVLIDALLNTTFISHLCISDSVISCELMLALDCAPTQREKPIHLEIYSCQINDDDVAKLESRYGIDNPEFFMFSKSSRWHQPSKDQNEVKPTVLPKIPINVTWESTAVTVAGNGKSGSELDQLNSPYGLYIDDDKTLLIADRDNHRIVEWKFYARSGQVIAGGNGPGNKSNQLNKPTGVVIDKTTNTIVICDSGNKRVMRWPRRNGATGEVVLENISCRSLSLPDGKFLYISDNEKHEIKRYNIGEKDGIVVAGGHGKGNRIDQLSAPSHFAVDMDQSVYVSDHENHRVTKWIKGAKKVVVVTGGNGSGKELNQVSYPNGLFVDYSGNLYVTEFKNPRVTRWVKGATEGVVIAGGNIFGSSPEMLSTPESITFDCDGNLYVADCKNHRVQRFYLKNTL